MKSSIKKLTNIFFFSIIGISIPYLEFISKNLAQIDYVILKDTTSIFLISFFLLLIVLVILKKFFKNINDLLVLYFCTQYLFFKFSSIKHLLSENKIPYDGELSFLIIILGTFFIFLLRKQSTLLKFLKFYIIFYFVFILLVSFIEIFQNYKYKNQNLLSNSSESKKYINSYFTEKEIEGIKKNKNKNIYLILFDGMTSLEEFNLQNKELNFNLNETYKKLSDLQLTYIKRSKSVFTTSYLSFSSIFNLNPVVLPNSPKYKDRSNFFPSNLLDKNSENYPLLLKTLSSINYKFKWVGTPWAECIRYDKTFCLSYNDETKENNLEIYYELNPNNNYVYDYFLSLTFIKPIIFNFKKIFYKEEKYFQWEYKTNDGIGKFLNSIKKSDISKKNNYFYFIHHMAPHWPYVYSKDCSERIDDSHVDNNFLGYKESYLCSLKKIEEFMKYINQNDPEAIVIMQGDHGFEFDETGNLKDSGFTKENALKRLKHFNSIKINNVCKKYLSNTIGNINGVRLALSCATNTSPKLVIEKHLVGYYETQENNYGIVKKLDDLD